MPSPELLRSRASSLCAAAFLVAGVALAAPPSSVPESPARPWTPPAAAKLPPVELPALHDLPDEMRGMKVSLGQILDLALSNSPLTRQSWFAAKAAAAELGSRRATLYPRLDLTADLTRVKRGSASGTGFNFLETTYGPSATISWLLLDFGGRHADIGDARDSLLAADWSHNAELQSVVLTVEQAYYQYLGAAAQHRALADSIREAEANLAAAEERRAAGVATIADVLQAKTALTQQELTQVQLEGQMKSLRGALATAVGVRPDVDVQLGELPEVTRPGATAKQVQELLEQALADRPDLQAARAQTLAAQQRVRKARSDGLPSLALSASGGRLYYPTLSQVTPTNSYQAQLALDIPLFTGFDRRNKIAKARAEAAMQDASLESLVQQVMLQVWTAYYDLQSAAQQIITSHALLASAEQSANVASGRYKAGVGSILDSLTAQSAVANARAQEIQARAAWFLAMAQLQHDVGALTPPNADDSKTETRQP